MGSQKREKIFLLNINLNNQYNFQKYDKGFI